MAITQIFFASLQSATEETSSAGLPRQPQSSIYYYGMAVATLLEFEYRRNTCFYRKHSITQTEQNGIKVQESLTANYGQKKLQNKRIH